MFTLTPCRSKFYRVKGCQTQGEIARALSCPVTDDVFDGAIICVSANPYERYVVGVGEDYGTIAKKFNLTEDCLRQANGNVRLFPACAIFLPLGQK